VAGYDVPSAIIDNHENSKAIRRLLARFYCCGIRVSATDPHLSGHGISQVRKAKISVLN